jgi:hypothetical protein
MMLEKNDRRQQNSINGLALERIKKEGLPYRIMATPSGTAISRSKNYKWFSIKSRPD